MVRNLINTHITALATTLPINVPNADKIAKGVVHSDVGSGMTITLEPGPQMWQLHGMIANGLVLEVSFTYKEAEKDADT